MRGYSLLSSNNNKVQYVWIFSIILTLIVSIAIIRLVTAMPIKRAVNETGVSITPSSQNTPAVNVGSLESAVTPVGDQPSTHAKVTVNGQNIPVPQNGSVQKTIETNNGNSHVDVSVRSDASGTSETYNSTNLNLDYQSTLQVTTDNTE